MRAEKCRYNFERLFAIELVEKRQDFAFAGPVETVAGFCFDGCGSVGGEFLEMRECTRLQPRRRCGAEFVDGVENTAARMGDFFVRGARDAHFVFGSAGGCVDQMCMRINKTGKNDLSAEVNFLCATRLRQAFDVAARANGGDAAIVYEECAILDNTRISERAATARRWSAERENLRAICEEQGISRASHLIRVHGTEKMSAAQDVKIDSSN